MILLCIFYLIQVALSFKNINIYNDKDKYLGSISTKPGKCISIKGKGFRISKTGNLWGFKNADCTGICRTKFRFTNRLKTASDPQKICLSDVTFKAVKEPIHACKGTNQWKRKGRCFTLFSSKKTWDEAQERCTRFRLGLATLRDTADNYQLAKRIKSNVWIGINDKLFEGKWTWVSGISTLQMWSAGNPNGGSEENCGEVWPHAKGRWNDQSCSAVNAYVCSVDSKRVKMPHPYCAQSSQIRSKGRCYTVLSKPRTWEQSVAACTKRGMTLATMRSKREQEKILSMNTANNLWIGLSDSVKEGNWKWVDGSMLIYKGWASGQPGGGTEENCAEIASDFGWKWNDKSCSIEQNPICQVDMAKLSRPHKWVVNGRSFFYFPIARSWKEASEICAANALSLATIRDMGDNQMLFSVLAGSPNRNPVWIGLNKIKGTFEWESGSSTFKNWANGEPNNNGGNEKCVELIWDNGRWNDIPCEELRPFVCHSDSVPIRFTYEEGDWWNTV